VVTDATKKLREPVAYILLAFAALSVLAVLILLFFGDSTFATNALRAQSRLAPGDVSGIVLLLVLAGSVWLVNEAGERTPNARLVTTVALAITGLALLVGLIATFSVFGANGSGGLLTATFISSLAGLALYGAVGYYIFTTFQSLPAAVRVPKAGQFGPQGQQYGGQYGQQQPPQFGQQGGQYGQPGQGQYPQQGQFDQGQQNQYGGYAAAAGAGAAAGAAGGYAAAQGGEQQWPQEQSWNQGEQQPAWSAGEADAQQHDPAWSASAQPAAEPTQQWSSEGQQQWSGQETPAQENQWPQEQAQSSQWADGGQQQWSGQDYPQQEWPSQSGQAEQAQPEGQTWQSGEQQAWPAEDAPAAEPKAAEQAPAAEPVADETRVDPRVSDTDKDDQGQQGQGQQGWWSQPS